MDIPLTKAAVLAALGIQGVAGIDSAPNVASALVLDAANVTTGTTFNDTTRVQSGRAFVVTSIVGLVWLPGVVTSSVAGTPLFNEADALNANNTHVPSSLVTVNFQFGQYTYSPEEMRWPNIIGTVDKPNVLLKPIIIGPNQNVQMKGTNGTAATISVQTLLCGHYVNVD